MAPLMVPRRPVMAALILGPATRHITTNRNTKVTASQKNWLGKVVVSNGGKPPSFLGTSVVCVVSPCSSTVLAEQDDQGHDQAEQTGRFAQREAQQQVGGLGGGSARIAQRAGEIAAEHVADADARAHESDTGDTGADHFCSGEFHFNSPF